MKKYIKNTFQKTKTNFKNLRSKAVVRFANLAKRLDQGNRKSK